MPDRPKIHEKIDRKSNFMRSCQSRPLCTGHQTDKIQKAIVDAEAICDEIRLRLAGFLFAAEKVNNKSRFMSKFVD